MSRIFTWFGGLTIVKKALIVAFALLLFVLFSPLIVPLAALVLLVSLVVVVYRMRRQRPFRGPGIFLLSSVTALILASGASAALYGTSTEQASKETPRAEPQRTEATTEPEQEEATVTKPKPEKTTEEAAVKPKPKPKPTPDPKPKSEPKPKPSPVPVPVEKEDENDKYDATVTVTRVVDGDTVEISPAIDGIEDVRLIGVDTPETVDPGEEVEPYGPEASSFATDTLTGRDVELEFDQERVDQYRLGQE